MPLAAVLLLIAARAVPRLDRAPVVDVSLFRRPAFAAANVAALVVFFAFIGAIVFLSAYFQQVRGDSPVVAGLQVSVLGVAFAVTAPLSGRLTGRVGARWPMVGGPVAAGAAMLGLLRLGLHTGAGATWWDFYAHGAHGFVAGLHAAMWVSGIALFGAAVLTAVLLPRAASPPAGRAELAALTTVRSAK